MGLTKILLYPCISLQEKSMSAVSALSEALRLVIISLASRSDSVNVAGTHKTFDIQLFILESLC